MVTIEDVFLEKMFKHYRLNGKAFACIENVGKAIVSDGKAFVSGFIGNDESENDSANDGDSNSDCDSE